MQLFIQLLMDRVSAASQENMGSVLCWENILVKLWLFSVKTLVCVTDWSCFYPNILSCSYFQ